LGVPRVVAAYLVRGKECALVDMGYQSSLQTIVKDLAEAGIQQLDYLLPTHVHLDHGGSCGGLASTYANASVLIHPKGEPHLVDPSRLVESVKQLFGDRLLCTYGFPVPIERKRVRAVRDDDVIALGRGVNLRSVWTPGHASHHLSYVLEGTGMIATGDAVSVGFPDIPIRLPTTPPTSFNLEKALLSLEKLLSFSPSMLLTPHFGVVHNAKEHISGDAVLLQEWRQAIIDLRARGLGADTIAASLLETACQKAHLSTRDIPEHLEVSMRVSVLGFLRYLQKGVSSQAVKNQDSSYSVSF